MMVHLPERSDARANHERLLSVAVAVFAARGTEAEVREIAERAGVGIGTIYRHFPDKDDLVLAVMDDAVRAFERMLAAVLALDDPVDALRTLVRESLTLAARYGKLFASEVEDHRPTEHDATDLLLRRRQVDASLVALIERGIRGGQLRADLDPLVAVAMIQSAVRPRFIAQWWSARTPDEVAEGFLEIFLHGAQASG
jgi:AcrR family transcriptional regulator